MAFFLNCLAVVEIDFHVFSPFLGLVSDVGNLTKLRLGTAFFRFNSKYSATVVFFRFLGVLATWVTIS